MAANPPNETPKLAIYEPFSVQELDDAKKLRLQSYAIYQIIASIQ